jgi:tRNA threonylcarbamoyladenosine biosynthesis protein TsaB
MIDARRMEVYSSSFDGKLKRLENDKAIVVDDDFTKRFTGDKIIYFGDGMEKCKSILEKDARSVFIENIFPNAKNMVQLSLEKFKNSEFEDLAYFFAIFKKKLKYILNPSATFLFFMAIAYGFSSHINM